MSLNTPLHFLILLTISTPIRSQFEFNDLPTAHKIVADTVQVIQVNCIAILKPSHPNPKQMSVIDELTRQLAKKWNSKHGTRRQSVMSYNLEQYMKFYMSPSMRNKDVCVYGITIVMVSNSTNNQLVQLSEESHNFERNAWLLFANRTEHATLLENVHIRVSTRLWIVNPIGNGLHNITEMGMLGKNVVSIAYIIWSNYGVVDASREFHAKITGLSLNVGTIQNTPYTNVDRNQGGQITSVTGFYGEMWTDLQETLKFNSVYIEPNDGTFGTYNANGTWTGLYRMIVRKQADVLLNAMTMSQSRHHVVDFLHSIQRTKYKIFYKKDAEIFDWLKVFRPLDYSIWVILVMWIIAGGTIAYFFNTFQKKLHVPQQYFSLISCIYFVLRVLCNQGPEQVPKLWALRIFCLTAYLLATVIVTSYSASLISVLTVKTPVEPFQELPDILATDYKLTINSDSTDYDFFEKTSDPIHRKIYETSVIKTQYFEDYREAIDNTCNKRKTVFFGTMNEVTVIYRQGNVTCVLLPLKSEISPAYKTIAVAKHSQYLRILNRRLFRMIEYGMINRYRRLYMPNAFETPLENEIGIGLVDVGAVFIYLCILQTLSVVIFCLELLSWKYYIRKNENKIRQY